MLPRKSQQTVVERPCHSRPHGRTLRVLVLAAIPTLLLHGIVIGGLPLAGQFSGDVMAAAPVRVRAVVAAVLPPAAVALAQPKPAVTAAPTAPNAPKAPKATNTPTLDGAITPPEPASLQSDAVVEPLPEPVQPVAAEVDLTAAAPEPDSLEGEVDASSLDDDGLLLAAAKAPARSGVEPRAELTEVEGEQIPVFATAVAPSQNLQFDLKRGLLSGTSELIWRRDALTQPGASYEMQLLARIGSLTILTQKSSGGFDKAGLAPLRFTDQRLRGSVRAANFQRQRGIISFSGPSVEFGMVRGVQDRLSWMLQLPAIVAANPRLAAAGEPIPIYVVGSRGDASVWAFRFEAIERIRGAAGEVDALKFSRLPRKPHDTLAEVWLEPARHHLPLRARIGNPDDGAMLELSRTN